MRSSPINALQVERCDPPLYLRLPPYLSDKFLFRVLQLSSHPLITKLHFLNEKVTSSSYWTHKTRPSLVNSFLMQQNIKVSFLYFQPILILYFYLFYFLLPNVYFDLDIDKNHNNINVYFNLVINSKWPESHYIYSDASKRNNSGCTGVGLFHSQYKIVQKIKLPPESSVFTGECFGLFKAVEYILIMKLQNTVIFTDAKSALEALVRFPFQSKTSFPLIIETRSKFHLCYLRGYSASFVWIPSHCGIDGNERADELVKQAVDCGDIFPYKNCYHDLASLTRLHLWKSWNEVWTVTSRLKGKFYFNIQPSIPKGCPNCGFSYCSSCLNNKVYLPKVKCEKKVCAKCKRLIDTDEKKEVFTPPDAYYKRLAATEEKSKNQQIQGRLQKLKKDNECNSSAVTTEEVIAKRLQTIKGDTPSTEELQSRLAKLRGMESLPSQAKAVLPAPDVRTEQEQADDLMKQYIEQAKIETDYKKDFDGIINDIEARVQKLKETTGTSAQSASESQGILNSEDEDETLKKIIEKVMDQSLLEHKEISPTTNEELPFCEICNEDARMRCLGCQYLFCKRCFLDHKDDDDGCNRYEPYTPPGSC